MSYFGEELTKQMELKKVTGIELASRTSISSAQISKWTRGEQTSLNEPQLSVMQAALGDDAHDHARLVLAHLLDERFGLNSELVEVSVRDTGEMRDYTRPRSKGEAAIAFLSVERVRNRELNDLLIDLARLLQPANDKSGPAAVNSARQKEIDQGVADAVKQGTDAPKHTPPAK